MHIVRRQSDGVPCLERDVAKVSCVLVVLADIPVGGSRLAASIEAIYDLDSVADEEWLFAVTGRVGEIDRAPQALGLDRYVRIRGDVLRILDVSLDLVRHLVEGQ